MRTPPDIDVTGHPIYNIATMMTVYGMCNNKLFDNLLFWKYTHSVRFDYINNLWPQNGVSFIELNIK